MKYSPMGSNEFCSWASAAKRGGTTPLYPAPGEPRICNVNAWIDVDEHDPITVANVWMSELPEGFRKPFLKELGLPVTKDLIYKDIDGSVSKVVDIKVVDVWDGWCNVIVRLADGSVLPGKIHSMYFAEMNSGVVETDVYVTGQEKLKRKRTAKSKHFSEVKGMPLNFYVVDLETTSKYPPLEICEIAALRVIDGEVVDTFETLVYIDGEIEKGAADTNHITKDMLQDAPHMRSALEAFFDFIGSNAVLVGHNIKSFDIPNINKVCDKCGKVFEYREAIDTYALAKRAWPDLASYKMNNLRELLGLDQQGSHRACKDCNDEYALYMRIREDVAAGLVSIEPPARSPSRPKTKRQSKWARKKAKEFITEVISFDESHPLFGKNVVLSGDVEGISYNNCLQAVCDLGGHPQDNVTKKTNYLVVGENAGKNKLAKAQEYKNKGQSIEIIDAATFVLMIS